jgi:lysophospholipase L1-like esterase
MDSQPPVKKIVFIGDSVTAAHRSFFIPNGLGYVRFIQNRLNVNWHVLNKGANGDRLIDLETRWVKDVVKNSPNIVSINIGINDSWQIIGRRKLTSNLDFDEMFRRLMHVTHASIATQVVLCEPFILPCNNQFQEVQEDLKSKLAIIRALAVDLNLPLVEFDSEMARLSEIYESKTLARDGIHPTKFGHIKMAEFWLTRVQDLVT